MGWTYNGFKERKGASILGEMKERYEKIYTSLDYGPIATARGFVAAQHCLILFPPPMKVLCVGAGNAYEAVFLADHGYDVTVVDYTKAPVRNPKFKQIVGDGGKLTFKDNEFDLVLCCECIEHIPEDKVEAFVLGLRRVATFFYFTVDDEDDPPYHSHLCIHEAAWWFKKFKKWGLTGEMFKPGKYYAITGNKIIQRSYPSGRGFNIYGNKVLS